MWMHIIVYVRFDFSRPRLKPAADRNFSWPKQPLPRNLLLAVKRTDFIQSVASYMHVYSQTEWRLYIVNKMST